MKKLQNNFTTPEQSKRLLELGVPADSADHFYVDGKDSRIITAWKYGVLSDPAYTEKSILCWSVGRLMEIINICNLTAEKTWVYIERDNIHVMITAIIDGVNNRMLDFSKLEE